MRQLSNNIFYDSILDNIEIPTEKFLGNQFRDYPFLLIENFISFKNADFIFKSVQDSYDFEFAKVKAIKNSVLDSKIDKSIRKTHIYDLNSDALKIYLNGFEMARREIESYFNIALLNSSGVQALGYPKGGYYIRHSDNCNDLVDKDGNLIGFKLVAPERKLTTVLFLNDNFTGGELVFNFLYENNRQFTLKPKKSLLIAFPSNPFFTHEVKEVKSGYRVSLAEWHNAIL